MNTILLKFSGPLQSWGTDSHFETRHTDSYPSKSAVIGMIAAGLGYHRDEYDRLIRLNTLGYAVRIDQIGQIMGDFHTAKAIKAKNPYVTKRYYLQDAVFMVALSSSDEELINDAITAVKNPYFSLFLGRRSLPPTADLLLGTFDTDAITVLKEYPWQASAWYQKKHSPRLQIFADETLLTGGNIRVRNDIAVSFSQMTGRKFSPRKESRILVQVPGSEWREEHDAFGAIGES